MLLCNKGKEDKALDISIYNIYVYVVYGFTRKIRGFEEAQREGEIAKK